MVAAKPLSEPFLPAHHPVSPFVDATPLLADPAALRAHAAEHGYLFLPGALPLDKVEAVRAFVRAECERRGWVEPAEGNPPEFVVGRGAKLTGHGWDDPAWVSLQRAVRLAPAFRTLVRCDEVRAIFDALWGEPPREATANMCWIKLPGSPAQTTRPHQDRSYLREGRFWTFWFPLTDTPFDVGPLAIVPGSHQSGLWPHIDNLTGILVPPEVAWVSGPVRPGDVVLFGELTIHAAWSNMSANRVRVSFDVRYEPASAGTVTPLHPAPFEGS